MERSRVTRYIRIAVTALSLTACVPLVALWVRSYWVRDTTISVISGPELHLTATSLKGEVAIAFDRWAGTPHPWMFRSASDRQNMVSVFPDAIGTAPLSWLGFRWLFRQTVVVVVLPYWFVALVGALVGASPWIPWRFSLRTLLIATTLVAVVLGGIVYLVG